MAWGRRRPPVMEPQPEGRAYDWTQELFHWSMRRVHELLELAHHLVDH